MGYDFDFGVYAYILVHVCLLFGFRLSTVWMSKSDTAVISMISSRIQAVPVLVP